MGAWKGILTIADHLTALPYNMLDPGVLAEIKLLRIFAVDATFTFSCFPSISGLVQPLHNAHPSTNKAVCVTNKSVKHSHLSIILDASDRNFEFSILNLNHFQEHKVEIFLQAFFTGQEFLTRYTSNEDADYLQNPAIKPTLA